jgi:hypothetical protein
MAAKTDNKIKHDTVQAITDKIIYEAGIAGAQSERQQRENMMDFHGDEVGKRAWRVRHGMKGN